MTVAFECQTMIHAGRDRVFDLSLSVDAHLASMTKSGERAVAGVTRGTLGLGEQVTWRASHFGIRFTMTSKIVELRRPTFFVDEQVAGPFRRFRHEHEFEVTGETTVMTDRVKFDAPLRPLGLVAERLFLGQYLRSLIAERNEYLRQTAEDATP